MTDTLTRLIKRRDRIGDALHILEMSAGYRNMLASPQNRKYEALNARIRQLEAQKNCNKSSPHEDPLVYADGYPNIGDDFDFINDPPEYSELRESYVYLQSLASRRARLMSVMLEALEAVIDRADADSLFQKQTLAQARAVISKARG